MKPGTVICANIPPGEMLPQPARSYLISWGWLGLRAPRYFVVGAGGRVGQVATWFVKGTQVTTSELPVAGQVEAGKQNKPDEGNVAGYLKRVNSAMDMEFEDDDETLLSSSKLFGLITLLFFTLVIFMFWTDNPEEELLCLAAFVFLSIAFLFCFSALPGVLFGLDMMEMVDREEEGAEEGREHEEDHEERDHLLAKPLPSYQSLFFSEKPPNFNDV